jgi:hypothetical protein
MRTLDAGVYAISGDFVELALHRYPKRYRSGAWFPPSRSGGGLGRGQVIMIALN